MPLPALAGDFQVKKAADWIQHEYASAFKGSWRLDRSRALEYAKFIRIAAQMNDIDPKRYLAQIAWESAFLNNIRDRKLPFHSWSYGLCGIQVETARQFYPKIAGRDLVENYDLNIMLGACQMRRLLNLTGNLQNAERAYNCGYAGMRHGQGRTYPGSITTTEKKWKKFESEVPGDGNKN
jgi:soluble lytic murein transglycosylase-like protein